MTSRGEQIGFFCIAALAVIPLWLSKWVPSQDWAQHVAAVRVLVDHDAASLRLADGVVIDLARTQYVGFYLLAGALAKIVGATAGVKVLISCSLIAIPYALRALLRVSGTDERYAVFAVSLTYNVHLVLGFLPFLAAVPLSLFAMHAAARYRLAPSLGRGLSLSALLTLLFYMHVLPFALALTGAIIVVAGCSLWGTAGALLAIGPPLALALHWTRASAAGGSTLALMRAIVFRESSPEVRYDPLEKSLREFTEWLTDILPGAHDKLLLLATCILLVGSGVAFRDARSSRKLLAPLSVRLLIVMPVLSLFGALVMPYQYGWIWPVAGRFPYLTLLLLPLALPRMKQRLGDICTVMLAALAIAHVSLVALAFHSVAKEETRGFDGALAAISRGENVLGLMYESTSKHVRYNVLMHYQAYVQATRGGIVMFSFGELPQSPFAYRAPPLGPPALNLGVGWAPQNADMRTAASYFGYVLTHGENPHLKQVEMLYRQVFRENGWAVYRRR